MSTEQNDGGLWDHTADEVLGVLLAHDALLACDCRADLEMIALRSLPEALWLEIECMAPFDDVTVGEALYGRYRAGDDVADPEDASVKAMREELHAKKVRAAYIEFARIKACPGTAYLLGTVG